MLPFSKAVLRRLYLRNRNFPEMRFARSRGCCIEDASKCHIYKILNTRVKDITLIWNIFAIKQTAYLFELTLLGKLERFVDLLTVSFWFLYVTINCTWVRHYFPEMLLPCRVAFEK